MYQQTSILIVEDDGVLAQGLKRALKTEEREIKICGKLREAREILRDGLPDLMILDDRSSVQLIPQHPIVKIGGIFHHAGGKFLSGQHMGFADIAFSGKMFS